MIKTVFTESAPKPIGPYSQALAAGNTLYCSGQIPLDPDTGLFIGGDIAAQTRRVCENIGAVLSAAGHGFRDVVKTCCFLLSMDDFPVFNSIYEEFFISKPARSCVAAKELPKGASVEIEVISVKNV